MNDPYKYNRSPETLKNLLEKHKELYADLKTRDYTLRELGEKYHMSHEYVRVLYYAAFGKPYKNNKHEKYLAAKAKRLDDIVGTCSICGKEIKRRDRGLRYCNDCRYDSRVRGRALNITVTCDECGKPFHPTRAGWAMSQPGHPQSNRHKSKYCSQLCYWATRGVTLRVKDYPFFKKEGRCIHNGKPQSCKRCANKLNETR